MSERLRKAYEKKREAEIRRRVNNLPWNRRHLARMRQAGEEFNRRRRRSRSVEADI